MTDLYEDVVVGGQPPTPTKTKPSKKPSADKDSSNNSDNSSERKEKPRASKESSEDEDNTSEDQSTQEEENEGKDDRPQSAIAQRAEKMAENPFMTQAEIKNMDGDSKEKEKKADKAKKSDKDKDRARRSEMRESKKELDILSSRAEKILFTSKGLFPFDFFPNTITIDANKVNIIIKTFFFTETVTSILLKEIMDVRVEATLFLGKLIIDYGPHPLKIWTAYVPALWKSDALRAKEIIEGMLVIYRAENIDTTKLKPEDTLQEIKNVGKVDEERP